MINLGTMRVFAGGGGATAHMDDSSGGWGGGDNNDDGWHGTSVAARQKVCPATAALKLHL